MKSIVHHGILELAQNSFIANCEIEALEIDPTPVQIGRIWFNIEEKIFKYSGLDEANNIIIQTFSNNVEVNNFITNLQSSFGASLIGYSGNNINPNFQVDANDLKSTIDILIDEISVIKSALLGELRIITEEFIVENEYTNQFILSKDILDSNKILVSINGMVQSSTAYTINSNMIDFIIPLATNDIIKIVIFDF